MNQSSRLRTRWKMNDFKMTVEEMLEQVKIAVALMNRIVIKGDEDD